MSLPQRRTRATRQYPSWPSFVPAGIFPILSLPLELTIHIASFLTPRGIFALLLTSPAFEHLISVFTPRYTREEEIYEDRVPRHYTPLQYFCSRGVERVVRRMLESGVNPNQVITGDTNHQTSPLIHAIAFRSPNIVELLLRHGANVDEVDIFPRKIMHSDSRNNTPLQIAVGAPNSIPPRRTHDRIGYAIRGAELPRIVQLLLNAGANVNARNQATQTPLQIACSTVPGNPLIVRSLLAAGADIDPGTNRIQYWYERDFRPFHYAANAGNVEIVRILIDTGVNVNARTRHLMTALDMAILHMRRDLVEVLVAGGADVSTPGACRAVDPFHVVSQTATWEEFRVWLHARGVQGNGNVLNKWWTEGKGRGMHKSRAGDNSAWKKWTYI
ncbi:hypothetical protein Q9L58_002267 [Maublancomyces gigas]|uniref:F-box domain-containing protein n=1 Tax=Discina gigas TaxID=1032678 RepID=A0ABR3GRY6_9PEZI